MISTNVQSDCWVTSLPVKLQVDWYSCSEELINIGVLDFFTIAITLSWYNGLEIIKNVWFNSNRSWKY